ncbi:hypothetical protein [Microbacterium sp. Leaf159]|uniref:hypothetical protein n=1 Tax=Microbacterium sp. Leaf159 TaxID=1736279 RepID=UPI000B0E6C41|nr:hypothetical protein [Microbacterium sp. Leaf159]
MTRIEVDPEELAAIAKAMRRDVEEAKKAVDTTPEAIDGGVACEPIGDVVERVSAWLGVLGQVHSTLAVIVDDIGAGVLRDEEEISAGLLKAAAVIELDK